MPQCSSHILGGISASFIYDKRFKKEKLLCLLREMYCFSSHCLQHNPSDEQVVFCFV